MKVKGVTMSFGTLFLVLSFGDVVPRLFFTGPEDNEAEIAEKVYCR